jgi:acyl-CoA thioesterase-2
VPDVAGATGSDHAQAEFDGRVHELADLLALEPIGVDRYRGPVFNTEPVNWVFGGQLTSQALMAAGRTVDPDRVPHSLHAYFTGRGDAFVPVDYTVERISDGRSYATRRVVAAQHDKTIFTFEASFQLPQDGLERRSPGPAAPSAQALLAAGDQPAGVIRWPFERLRAPAPSGPPGEQAQPATTIEWLKARRRLPDDPLIHACAFAFATDIAPTPVVLEMNDIDLARQQVSSASLDHALWLHRPVRADEWLLYEWEAPTSAGGRGFAIGRVFAEDGRQVATVVQETTIRIR